VEAVLARELGVSQATVNQALHSLRQSVEQMRTASKARHLANFYLADYEFHQELYRLSQNRFLVQACRAIASAPFAYILCDRPRPLPTDYAKIAQDHEEIIQALLQGPEQAVQITHTKVGKWLKWQREFLTDRSTTV